MLCEPQKGSQLHAKLMMRFGFLIFQFHPSRKITENLFTVMENIFQKKNFVLPLGFQQNVIAGTKWAKLSRQLHLAHFGWPTTAQNLVHLARVFHESIVGTSFQYSNINVSILKYISLIIFPWRSLQSKLTTPDKMKICTI